MCEKTLRCWVSSPMLISERKRLAFAPGREGGGRMTLRWARNCGVRRGLFAGVQDTSFHSLRDGTEAAAEAEPRVTPTLLGFIKIPRINRLLFLIYLHLFSIKESVT